MLYLTVHLYGQKKMPGEFREYEKKALEIFKRHGGEIMVAYAPAPSFGSVEFPDEIQVLRIASQAALDRFMDDPDRQSLAAERISVISRTEVFLSGELVEY